MELNRTRKKHPARVLFFIFALLAAVFIAGITIVHAETMSDSRIADFLEHNEKIFNNNDIVEYTGRKIGWGIISLLVWIADACETLYDTAFGFIDFTSWDKVNQFAENFKPVFIAVMAVSIFALGIMTVFNSERKPNIVRNICIACLCVTCSTTVFQELNGLAYAFKDGIENTGTAGVHQSEVYTTIDDSLVDLVVLADRFGSLTNLDYEERDESKKRYTNPGINEDNFKYIDFTEVLNPKSDQYSWSSSEREILSKKLYFTESLDNGVVDVNNGFGWNSSDDADMANEFYYRYSFDFFAAGIKLIAYIIVYVCMSYKCVRIAYELVVARFFAIAYSAELSGGEKISKILVFIRDSYVLLLTTTLCIRLYGLLNTFISGAVESGFVEVVFILFAAFCVIDGPNLVEKLLGMDAGLSSSTARMMAAYGVMRGAASVATAPARAAGGYMMRRHEQNRFLDKMSDMGKKDENGKVDKDDIGVDNTGSSAGSVGDPQESSSGSATTDPAADTKATPNAGHMMDDHIQDAVKSEGNKFDPSFMNRSSGSEKTNYFNKNMNTERSGSNMGKSDDRRMR